MLLRNDRWTLRGTVSMGVRGEGGRCKLTEYVVFSDVAKHTDWIWRHT